MNVKETKTKIKNWCEEHDDLLFYAGMLTYGTVIGVCFGKAMGSIIANDYDRTYKMALHDGYDRGRVDTIAIMLSETNNSEVVKALAEHMTKYYKEA